MEKADMVYCAFAIGFLLLLGFTYILVMLGVKYFGA